MVKRINLGKCEKCEHDISIARSTLIYRELNSLPMNMCSHCLYSETRKRVMKENPEILKKMIAGLSSDHVKEIRSRLAKQQWKKNYDVMYNGIKSSWAPNGKRRNNIKNKNNKLEYLDEIKQEMT